MTLLLALALRLLKRKRKRKRKRMMLPESLSPPPSPPPPPPDFDDGLLICARVEMQSDLSTCFLRFKIPTHTMDKLFHMVKSDGSMNIVCYVRHRHNNVTDLERFFAYSLDLGLNGPFSSDLGPFFSSSSIGGVLYCLGGECREAKSDGACHSVSYCDLGQRVPQWKISKPLYCHRFWPTIVTLNDKLYVFEQRGIFKDEDEASKRIPLGFLFDPVEECCKEVPFCAFHGVGVFDLVVAPMGKKLLVVDKTVGT